MRSCEPASGRILVNRWPPLQDRFPVYSNVFIYCLFPAAGGRHYNQNPSMHADNVSHACDNDGQVIWILFFPTLAYQHQPCSKLLKHRWAEMLTIRA